MEHGLKNCKKKEETPQERWVDSAGGVQILILIVDGDE
jgi:hypothetical protein